QFHFQGLLKLPHRSEILIQPGAIAGADPFGQKLAVVGYDRQHTLLQKDFGIGLPIALGRVLKARAYQPRIQAKGRNFRRIDAAAAQTGVTLALVAATGYLDRAESRSPADGIRDR